MIRSGLILTIALFWSAASAKPLDNQEQLAGRADVVLKHLGGYLEESITREDFSKDLVADFQVNLQWQAGEAESLPGGFVVTRTPKIDGGEVKISGLDDLRKKLGGKILRTKFKIINVELIEGRPDEFTTRQLVSLLPKTDQGHREINTKWQARWRQDGEQVVLAGLSGDVSNGASLKGGAFAFQDLTNQVLRLDPADEKRLLAGVNDWLPRLERALQPEFFALSGVSVADVNGDGRDDVYLCQLGGMPNALFIQQTDGTFLNQAQELGVDFQDNCTCALFVDFDNDGDEDLALAGASGLAILENDSRGKFTLKKLHAEIRYSYSLCAADYDRDGLVDLYACRYYGNQTVARGEHSVQGSIPVPHPVYDARNGGRNTLLRNTGDLGFVDRTDEAGLNEGNDRFTYAAFWDDFDNDGDQDLYVANDFGGNNYYQNEGGRFSDVTESAGLLTGELSMGACSADFNGDSLVDIHVSNMFSSAGSRVTRQAAFKSGSGDDLKTRFQLLSKGNALNLNAGKGKFRIASDEADITVGRWSWASLAPDLNNDGWDDLLVANGFITGRQPDDL